MILCKNLNKKYSMGEREVKALDELNMAIQFGEFVAIVGKSGSGKSTLLNMIGGIDKVDSGEILFSQKDIAKLSENELTMFRRENIGFVFQSYNLIPELNVKENILFPLYLLGEKVNDDYFKTLIEDLDLGDRLSHLPSELSGGQMQRVAIARAMIHKPCVLLCDEPTGNLDSDSANKVMNAIIKIKNKYNQTLVVVTHDEEVAKMADRYVVIKDGKLIKW